MGGRSSKRGVGKRSAGILLHRVRDGTLEVLLVHPGGPLWARRDAGVWSIPKGEYDADEDPLAAAHREFVEELGMPAPRGVVQELGEVRQRSGKLVRAWGLRGDFDSSAFASNSFELEWPPRSGKKIEVPEIDRAEWFTLELARGKLNPAQVPLLERLQQMLDGSA